MIEDLNGRVAVVTGGASGIGLAMAEAFLVEGMSVVLSDVDQVSLVAQVDRLSADAGGRVSGVVCDVVDPDAVAALADKARDRYGVVHVLCNNAGVGPAGAMLATTASEWRWTFDVNVLGVAHGVLNFAPQMVEAGVGHIVNVASQAGLMTNVLLGMYSASKHAVVGLSEALYRELELTSVGVSCLCPELVATEIFDVARLRPKWVDSGETSDTTQRSLAEILAQRGVGADLVANRVVEAIQTGRFWVFTHDVTVPAAMQRCRDIEVGQNPSALA